MRKRVAFFLVLGFFASLAVPAFASSFYGMVINVSIYSVTVKNSGNNQIMVFQIRPETAGNRYPKSQDLITVNYRSENGILVATRITVAKHYVP